MENKHVVLKQFIIKLKLTEQPKTIARVLTCPDIFDRCHIRTRHNGLFFPCLDKNIGQISIRYRKVGISFKRSLKIPENRIQQSFVYIRTKLNFTANSAVCPLSDHVTVIFSRQHQGALKDG